MKNLNALIKRPNVFKNSETWARQFNLAVMHGLLFGDDRLESEEKSSTRAVWHMYRFGLHVGALNMWYVRSNYEHYDNGTGFHDTLITEIQRLRSVLNKQDEDEQNCSADAVLAKFTKRRNKKANESN